MDKDSFFHPYTFDKFGKVYSDIWRREKPTFSKIYERQHFTGYYKLYGDTIVIERITNLTLGKSIPWKFSHDKYLGLVQNDTIKITKLPLEINEKKIILPLIIYLPLFDRNN